MCYTGVPGSPSLPSSISILRLLLPRSAPSRAVTSTSYSGPISAPTAPGEVGSIRLDLRRRRPIIGGRNPRGGRPNEVEGEVPSDDVEADREDGGRGTTGDRCAGREDPRLEIGLGAVGTDCRCGCSGSDSDEESVSSCGTVPLDCDATRGEAGMPIRGMVHSIKCEGRVSILVGRGLASNTT